MIERVDTIVLARKARNEALSSAEEVFDKIQVSAWEAYRKTVTAAWDTYYKVLTEVTTAQ